MMNKFHGKNSPDTSCVTWVCLSSIPCWPLCPKISPVWHYKITNPNSLLCMLFKVLASSSDFTR